jgi:DNA-binding transcriptional MerR regulator
MKTTPSFNLNVVVRETGIKPDTLRAWERRYGLPNPARTDGGHRLYSERDIAIIHWLIEQQNEGLRIKHAIDLWKGIEKTGQDPLLAKPTGQPPPPRKPDILDQSSPALGELRMDWINACLRFDEAKAEDITNYAFALNHAETVLFEVLLSGLAEIGEFWYRKDASVQQEHFASSLVARRLNSLISASPTPHKTGSILIGCPPGEDHTISPLTITFMLKQRGWRTIYLGANIPKEKLKETITSVKPNTVIMTAQHLETAVSLLDVAIHLSNRNIPLGFGGRIFVRNPNLHTKIPGYYLGNDLKNAANRIEEFLFNPLPTSNYIHLTTENQAAIEHYIDRIAEIEYELNKELLNNNISVEHIKTANRFMASNIQAYLQFGNMEYLRNEVIWTKEYLFNQNLDPEILQKYLTFYYNVTNKVLDERGNPIKGFLSNFINHQGDDQ